MTHEEMIRRKTIAPIMRGLPPKEMADLCLRCHEHNLWPEAYKALNNLSKNPTAFKDADGYICPLCGQEEDARHLRREMKNRGEK